MTIATILSNKGSEVATVATDCSLREAVAVLADRRIGALPVLDSNGAIAGMFSERDLVTVVRTHGESALDWPIERVMSAPAVTVDLSTPIMTALATMTHRRIRHLPVVEDGQIRGIVSIGDLVKHRIDRIEFEAAAMRDYIQHS